MYIFIRRWVGKRNVVILIWDGLVSKRNIKV